MENKQYTFLSLMWEFMKDQKVLLVGYIIILMLMPLQDVGIPHIIGKIMESLRNNKVEYKYLYILIGIIVLLQLGYTANEYIETHIFPLFQKFICNKILEYIFDKSNTNLQDILYGKVISIMSHAPRTIYNYMDFYRSEIIPQFVVFVVLIVYLFLIHYALGLVFLILIVVYYYTCYLTMTRCKDISQKRENYLINVNEQVDDVLMNIVGILNASTTKLEIDRLNEYYDMYKIYGVKAITCTIKYKMIIIPVLLVSLVVFIYVGSKLVANKKIKIEGFVVGVMLYLYIFNSIIGALRSVRDASIRGGMVDEHLGIFNSMNDMAISTSKYLTDVKQYILFDHIYFSYGNKQILNDFNLEINRGDKILITCLIGCGKSTILKLLLRYNNPSSGHVYFKGFPIDKIPVKQLRKQIGYIPQNPILLNRTLYENIVYGTENVSKADVLKLLEKLEIKHIFNEQRLDQYVGKHGNKLSGGQRQVVWILRTLIQDPEVLIMDEPTSALDKDTKTFIDRLFEQVMKNRTVIIVSHDEYMSKLCNRVIKLQE